MMKTKFTASPRYATSTLRTAPHRVHPKGGKSWT